MRELQLKYNTKKFRYELWRMNPDDPWDAPLLVSTLTEHDITCSLNPKKEVNEWYETAQKGVNLRG